MARDELDRLASLPVSTASQSQPSSTPRQRTTSSTSTPSHIPRWSRKSMEPTNAFLSPASAHRPSSRLSQASGLGSGPGPRSRPASRATSYHAPHGRLSSSLKGPKPDRIEPRQSLGPSSTRRPNAYTSQAHRTIDRLVGSVVNEMPVCRLRPLFCVSAHPGRRSLLRLRQRTTAGRTRPASITSTARSTSVVSCGRRRSWVSSHDLSFPRS